MKYMDANTMDAKERIMNTVVSLMLAQKDLSKVTNREIAALAGVNSALINYYYQSKENLLNQAVGITMSQMAGQLLEDSTKCADPRLRLKNFLRNLSVFAVEQRHISELAITAEMKSGNVGTVATILPLLSEIYSGEKSEYELKLKALQIIIPLQVILLNPQAYKKSIGADVTDMTKSLQLLEAFIDNVL